jgi:hypothetical protein
MSLLTVGFSRGAAATSKYLPKRRTKTLARGPVDLLKEDPSAGSVQPDLRKFTRRGFLSIAYIVAIAVAMVGWLSLIGWVCFK